MKDLLTFLDTPIVSRIENASARSFSNWSRLFPLSPLFARTDLTFPNLFACKKYQTYIKLVVLYHFNQTCILHFLILPLCPELKRPLQGPFPAGPDFFLSTPSWTYQALAANHKTHHHFIMIFKWIFLPLLIPPLCPEWQRPPQGPARAGPSSSPSTPFWPMCVCKVASSSSALHKMV